MITIISLIVFHTPLVIMAHVAWQDVRYERQHNQQRSVLVEIEN